MKKIILFSATFVAIFACKKGKTSWNTTHLIPIVNDTLRLKNIVKGDLPITADANNLAVLTIDREILSIDPSTLVKIPDTTIFQNYALAIGSFTVPPGTTFVNDAKENSFSIPDVQLKMARIKSGTIKLKVENPVETPVIFVVSLPGSTKDGVEFSKTFLAPAKVGSVAGVVEEVIDLSGYTLNMTGLAGSSFNKLNSLMVVTSDPAGNPVTISSANVVKLTAKLQSIIPDYARGYFGQIDINNTSQINIPQLNNLVSGSIGLIQATVGISVINEFKVPATMKLNLLSNTNNSANTVNLSGSNINSNFNLNGASGSWSSLTASVLSILFDENNSNIPQYIGNLGSKMQVGYALRINPLGNVSGGWNEIFPNTKLKVRLNTSIPLNVNFNELTLRDTFAFNLKQNFEKTHVVSGQLILKAKNAFPFGINASLRLLNKNGGSVVLAPSGSVISGLLGTLNTLLGVTVQNSELSYVIPASTVLQLQDFDKIELTAKITSDDTSNNPIHINSFLGVQLFADFILKAKI